jgi:hypothetical protein
MSTVAFRTIAGIQIVMEVRVTRWVCENIDAQNVAQIIIFSKLLHENSRGKIG